MTNANNSVQSINRVFDLIEVLAEHPRGLLLSEVSHLVRLPKSTVHRLLLSLLSRGYVVKEPIAGKYHLTMRMFEVGCRVNDVSNVLTVSRPFCEQLADISKEIVHLVKQDGNDIIYLSKLDSSSSSVRTSSKVGQRGKMYCTGVGKAILANLPTEEAYAIWKKTDVERFTSSTITDWDNLLAELKKIKEIGYALDNEEHEQGVRCVAAPIFNFSGRPDYAMSISAPSVRMNRLVVQKYIPQLIMVTQEISRFLGYNVPKNQQTGSRSDEALNIW